MIRNLEWYNLNEATLWPLADSASCIDDANVRLPNNVLVDINVWFPSDNGERLLYVSSLSVSSRIATVILSTPGMQEQPIASVSVVDPEPHVQYALEPFIPGVAGWIVFGSAVRNNDKISSFNFSSYEQSQLLPHVVHAYQTPPIANVSKFNNATKLSGIVSLKGGDDVETAREYREINGIIREVAVIRLKNKPSEAVTDTGIYQKYYGPCGGRPESNSCGNPLPIEFINSVQPDCCGNIKLEFRGCSDIKFIQNESCSVAISCNVGLTDACITPDRLPDASGRLPNEYVDLCVSESIVSSESYPERYVLFGMPTNNFYAKPVTDTDLDKKLPRREDFSSKSLSEFRVQTGTARVVPNNELAIFGGFSMQSDSAARFIATLKPSGYTQTCLFRKLTAYLTIRQPKPGTLRNGGIVLNYNPSVRTHYTVEIDCDGTFTGAKCLRVASVDGNNSATVASVAIANLTTELQYQLTVTTIPADDALWLTAELTNNLDPEDANYVSRILGPVQLPAHELYDGAYGFTSYRSTTQFTRLIIDNAEV